MHSKLDEFKRFQNGHGTIHDEPAASFNQAMREIRAGQKTGHWSWYVFPTNKPSRAFNNKFALKTEEALAYLDDAVLRKRYVQFMEAVSDQLNRGADPRTLLMSNVDVHKAYDSAVFFKNLTQKNLRYQDVYTATKEVEKRLASYVNKTTSTPKRAGMAGLFAQLKKSPL